MSETPNTGRPDTGRPGLGSPDRGMPNSVTPNTVTPNTGTLNTGTLAASALTTGATVTDKPVGIVGLDVLGAAIAHRIAAAGMRTLLWDADATRRRAAAKAIGPRAEDAGSLTDIGMGCDIVLSTLPAAGFAHAVIGDRDRPGFAHDLAAGSLVVDMGVALPSDAQRLAALLGRGGIGLVDAPALGTRAQAEAGTLLLPIGGFVDFVEHLRPLLALLGRVERAGPPGRGHALAALVTDARFAQAEAARAALSVGASLGLAAELMPDVAAAAAAGPEPDDPRLAIARRLAAEHGNDPDLMGRVGAVLATGSGRAA